MMAVFDALTGVDSAGAPAWLVVVGALVVLAVALAPGSGQ